MLSRHPFSVDPRKLAEFRDRFNTATESQRAVAMQLAREQHPELFDDGPCQESAAAPVHPDKPDAMP